MPFLFLAKYYLFSLIYGEGVSWQIYSRGDGGMQLIPCLIPAHQDRAFLNIYPPGPTHWFQFKNVVTFWKSGGAAM